MRADLRQRIITGIIIAPVALGFVFLLPPFGFSLFIGAVLTVAAWEWANFAGLPPWLRHVYAIVVALVLAVVWLLERANALDIQFVLLVGVTWWLLAFLLVLNYPGFERIWGRKWVILLIGFFALTPGFLALTEIKGFDDSNYLICLLFFLIWGADIGAYFAGRAFGGARLASRVSPGKSWAGLFGGLAISLVIAAVMSLYHGSPSLVGLTGIAFLVACMLIAAISALGDLTISMLKRHRGIKDASKLLPGHGGFLDRIDSLLSASPAFALYLASADWL